MPMLARSPETHMSIDFASYPYSYPSSKSESNLLQFKRSSSLRSTESISPPISLRRSMSSLSFAYGPPSQLDLADPTNILTSPTHKKSFDPADFAADGDIQRITSVLSKLQPEQPCLPKSGSTYDMAYFLKNTGPPLDNGVVADSERSSSRSSLVGKNLNFSIFKRRKNREIEGGSSLQESRISGTFSTRSCVPMYSLQGKQYFQIITDGSQSSVQDKSTVRRRDFGLPFIHQETLQGSETNFEDWIAALHQQSFKHPDHISNTSLNETPPLQSSELPMVVEVQTKNRSRSGSGRSSISSLRNPLSRFKIAPRKHSLDQGYSQVIILPVQSEYPIKDKLAAARQVTSMEQQRAAPRSIHSATNGAVQPPNTLTTPIDDLHQRQQRVRDRKVRQLQTMAKTQEVEAIKPSDEDGISDLHLRPSPLRRRRTGTRVSLDERSPRPTPTVVVEASTPAVKNERFTVVKLVDPTSKKPPATHEIWTPRALNTKRTTNIELSHLKLRPEEDEEGLIHSPEDPPLRPLLLSEHVHSPAEERARLKLSRMTPDPRSSILPLRQNFSTIGSKGFASGGLGSGSAAGSPNSSVVNTSFPAPPRVSSRNSTVRLSVRKHNRGDVKTLESGSTKSSPTLEQRLASSPSLSFRSAPSPGSDTRQTSHTEVDLALRLAALERKNEILEAALMAIFRQSGIQDEMEEEERCESQSPPTQFLEGGKPRVDSVTASRNLSLPSTSSATVKSKIPSLPPIAEPMPPPPPTLVENTAHKRTMTPENAVLATVAAAAAQGPTEDLSRIFTTPITAEEEIQNEIDEVTAAFSRAITHSPNRGTSPGSSANHSRDISHDSNTSDELYGSRTRVHTAVTVRYQRSVERLRPTSLRRITTSS